MKLRLFNQPVVACEFCGYRRYLTDSEADNWRKRESHSGSQDCPACSGGHGYALNSAECKTPFERSVML